MGWSDRIRRAIRRARGSPAEIYADLRSMALTVDLESLEIPAGAGSGAMVGLMEIGTPDGTATFVAIADGSASMYTSTGGGVIGGGHHATVRAAAQRFLREAGEARGSLEPTVEFPLPGPGEVRFQVRAADGAFSAVASESALRARHPLSPLYAAGQDLVTEIRLMTEAKEGSRPD